MIQTDRIHRMAGIFLFLLMGFLFIPAGFSQTYTGDIEAYIGSYISGLPGSNDNDFSAPDAGELLLWEGMMNDLIDGELALAREKADQLNYQITEFTDNSVLPNGQYYVIEEKTSRQHYWGTYILNRAPLRNQLVIQSPHPRYDTNTGDQGVFCFKRLGALAFFVSGTHRCNHTSYSSCSGTTAACSSSATPYRISDNAHTVQSVFQKTTEVIFSSFPQSVFVQLHGFAKLETDPYVIMSNGTRITPDPDYAAMIRDELVKVDNVLTFKIPHIDTDWDRLIAFSNTQGRLINGSTSPCDQNATSCSGRFIHIEQERTRLRKDFITWYKMYEALMNVFPETSTSSGDKIYPGPATPEVYPNPSSGFIHIKTESSFSVSIWDAGGKCLFRYRSEGNEAGIELDGLSPGMYILRITEENRTTNRRIVLYNK